MSSSDSEIRVLNGVPEELSKKIGGKIMTVAHLAICVRKAIISGAEKQVSFHEENCNEQVEYDLRLRFLSTMNLLLTEFTQK